MTFTLIYNNNKKVFEIKMPYMESDQFYNVVAFFKRIYLTYNAENKIWYFKRKRIDELLLWFNKEKYTIELDESANQEISAINNEYKKELQLYRYAGNLDVSVLNDGVKLFSYQEQDILSLYYKNRGYNSSNAGLGKTIETITLFSILYKQQRIDSIFLIVRNGLAYHWKSQILEFSNVFIESDIHLIDINNYENSFPQDKKIIIVPNHLLSRIFAQYHTEDKSKLSNLRWNKAYCDIKKEWNKNSICLIIDEAHEFKNPVAVKTRALLSHKNFFHYRYLLSATPAINKFEDWWAQIHLLDESLIKLSYNAFKLSISKNIGDRYDLYNIIEYDVDSVERYKNLFKKLVIKRIKSELPEYKIKQIINPIYINMSEKHKDIYNQFSREFIFKLEKEYDRISLKLIMSKFPYLLQIIDNISLLQDKIEHIELNKKIKKWTIDNDNRIIYLDNALNEYINNRDEKVIVFDNHPVTLNILYDRYSKYKPILIHGELKDTQIDRYKKQDLFNDKNSENKLFLLNTQIGGVGLNLHKACHRIIFWSLPYDTTLTYQARDRIDRIVSDQDSIVDILILDSTIDKVRYLKNMNRIKLNESLLNTSLSKRDLENLLQGMI